jgi:adenine deaminase
MKTPRPRSRSSRAATSSAAPPAAARGPQSRRPWIAPAEPVRGAAPPTTEELHVLRQVAGGQRPADVAIRGGRVLHVHTGEVKAADVLVHGRHIAAVVPPGRLHAEQTVDAEGLYVAPTFVDAHVHIEYTMLSPGELARISVPHGTTTLLSDPDCVANVLGEEGVDYMRGTTTPLRIFQQVTSDVPRRGDFGLNNRRIEQAEILRRLGEPDAVSLGESNPYLLDIPIAEACATAIREGRRITGHTARLTGEPLWAYLAGGVGDDHNAATLEEVLERLRLGMVVTLQAGSMADSCADVLGRPDLLGLVASHICFAADDKLVEDLVDTGHIDHHVRSAVKLGVDPVLAVRMASLNAAAHFRIDHLVGSVTPSRLADLQLLPDLFEFAPVSVWVDGREVARDGGPLFDNTDVTPEPYTRTIRLGAALAPATLEVRAPDEVVVGDQAWVQAVEMYDGYYKRAFHVQLPVVDGVVQPDPSIDVAKIAVVDRHHGSGTAGLAFVRGFGLRTGAIAATTNCDNGNAVVVATSDADLLHALAVIDEIGGGFVCVADGEVQATVPLPIAGVMATAPFETVYEQSRAVNAAAAALGCRIHAPFMILAFVGLVGVPDLGLTERGLVDLGQMSFTDVVLPLEDGRPVCRCQASTPRTREELLVEGAR